MHSPDTARRIANARRNHDPRVDPRAGTRINTRDTPTPPSHHGHHTNHYTSAGHHRRHSSDDFLQTASHYPSTPPDRKRSPSGARSLRAPVVRNAADIESFLQSLRPVDTNMSNKESDPSDEHPPSESSPESTRPPHRDSHDLSLSPRQFTRDSLVTNMLLGLDKLSLEQMGTSFGGSRNAFDDSNIYSYGNDTGRTMSFNSRAGRGHAYTYSSDYEAEDRSSRRRRSNSSSGYQSGLGRINSMRELGGTPRAIHSRGGKGSKGSSTNSIDPGYVQVLGSQRWARGFGRSSSFDYGDARPSTSQQAPWHIEFSKSLFDNGNDHDYDAAPTPHVPAGPRRLTTVPSLPVLAPIDTKSSSKLTPKAPSNDRPRSMRSSKSASTVRQSDVKYNAQRSDVPSVPPVSIPPFDVDAAPAPHVGYEKTKDSVLDNPINAIQQATQQPKEKPGFFRRMFGSSSKASSQTPSTFPYLSSTANDSSSNKVNSLKSPTIPPVIREPPQTVTHTLQKKTSSFFKRRKQSITEMEPPPLPHIPNKSPARMGVPRPEPSPMGGNSRRAVDPFLQDSPTIQSSADAVLPSTEASDSGVPNRSLQDSPEITRNKDTYQRGFSPDYEPSPKAVIRAVDPNSSSDSVEGKQPRIELPSRPAIDRTMTSPPRSFLRDDSESEYGSPEQKKRISRTESRAKARKVGLKPGQEMDKKRRSSSPTVSKSKSYPSLGKPKEDSKAPVRQNSKMSSKASKKPSLPSLRIDSAEPVSLGLGTGGLKTAETINPASKSELDEPEQFVVGDPTEDDRQKALKIYEGNEDFIPRDKAAAWMGEEGPVRQRTLRAYMDNYDFENMSVCASLRQLCNRLLLRAETQQVDRILVAFSNRWCECNPNHGFKSMGKSCFEHNNRHYLYADNSYYRYYPHHLLLDHAPQYGLAHG